MEHVTKQSEIVQLARQYQEGDPNLQSEQRGLRAAFGAIGMLRLILDNHPQLGAQLAVELEHLVQRYQADPTPAIRVTVDVPLFIWSEWVKCYDVERAEVLFLQTMQSEIEKHKQKLLK